MKVSKRALLILALAFGGGCAAETAPEPEVAAIGETEQAVTIFDCQSELAMCVRQARGLRDLTECTTAFATCNTMAANEILDETQILNECRAEATICLNNAITAADIRSCRGVYRTCADDAIATADAVLDNAIGVAEDAIQQAADAATNVITTAAGVSSDAFGLLQQCREDATDCLDGVIGSNGIRQCRAIFDGCAADAVDLVDGVVQPPLDTTANAVACNAEFASCVLTLNSPFDCASTARMCLGL